jgi:transcriptional regulator with XRE-family HTH domain
MRPGQGTGRDQGSDEDRDPDQQGWFHLGQLVRERRTELGLTQAEIHSAGGPSAATLYLIETGRRGSYRPQVLRRLERALGWRAGSVRRVLEGGQPVLEGEEKIISPPGEDRPSMTESQAWMASFRRLPISRHEKLLILSRLLEEVIAELSTGLNDEPAGPHRASRP